MNVNWDKKCILMCHPFTGEKDVCEYFGKIGFIKHYFLENTNGKPLGRNNLSNKFLYPWTFDDFRLIVTVDNPYRRIVNEYKRFSHINWSMKKNTKEDLYIKFNNKFDNLLFDDLHALISDNKIRESQYNFLLPYNFDLKKPDYIIRVESLVEDVYKIDILDHIQHSFSLIDQIDLSDNFKDVFSYENARIIYKIHKHIFEMFDYDPFSFTSKDLSLREKVHFIHY